MCYLCNNYGFTLRATKDLNKRPKDPKERGRSEEQIGEKEEGKNIESIVQGMFDQMEHGITFR